ncbi:MAG: DUF3267 domain-containing protein [Chloroflexota bacterium]|nr:MAG: DUF3267 domain-containing protein [Chloroflexota bacterium]
MFSRKMQGLICDFSKISYSNLESLLATLPQKHEIIITMVEHPLSPGVPPQGYREVLYWKITENPRLILLLNLMGVPLFFAAGAVFFSLAVSLGRLAGWAGFNPASIVLLIVSVILTLVLHELVHGITMRAFGAQPQYGVMWDKMLFYATSPGYAFQRNAYLVVCLAPLIALSVLALVLIAITAGTAWPALFAIAATVNASGAIGDLWIFAKVLRYPAHAFVMDEKDGMRVFLPSDTP